MDHMELRIFRMAEPRPFIPSWAKAEQMEICTPQEELWKYADEPARLKAGMRWINSETVCF